VTEQPYAIVKRAVDKTRSHAGQQALGMIALTAGLIVMNPHFPIWVIVFIVLNTWVTFVMGRRWLRLRKQGPLLLTTPDRVTSIAGWPAKLPPGRMPLILEVHTQTGMCSINIDPKKPAEVAALVDALRTRSPNAPVTVPLPSGNSPAA